MKTTYIASFVKIGLLVLEIKRLGPYKHQPEKVNIIVSIL